MAMTFVEIYFDLYALAYILVQFICYGVLYRLFSGTHLLNKNPLDAAHNFVALGSFAWLGFYGAYTWFFDPGFPAAFADDKIFSSYEPARQIIHGMLAFMVWDTTHLILARAGPEFFMHHIVVFVLGTIGLMYGGPDGDFIMLYYAVYFFGVSEVSSIPLAVVDLFRGNKDLAKAFPKVNERIRIVFAVFFFVLRVLYWFYVVVSWVPEFFSRYDTIALWAFIPFGISCILLTGLQWFWGYLIIKGALKMAGGQRSKETDDMEEHISQRRGSATAMMG